MQRNCVRICIALGALVAAVDFAASAQQSAGTPSPASNVPDTASPTPEQPAQAAVPPSAFPPVAPSAATQESAAPRQPAGTEPVPSAKEDKDEARNAALAVALDALAAGEDVEAAEHVRRDVLDPSISGEKWHEFYQDFFSGIRFFTPGHAAFWAAAIADGGADAVQFAQASCHFAIEAAVACLRRDPPNLAEAGTALQWLDHAIAWLGPERTGPTGEALRAALETPLDLHTLLTPGTPSGQTGLQMAIQTALSLSAFVEPAAFSKLVVLPESTRTFYAQRGVFVFDNGLLTPAQLQSLDSLIAAFPSSLHQIAAIIVPDGLQTTTDQLNLVSPRQIVDIAAIPIEVLSDPAEFIPRAGQPIAPAFTLEAGLQILRAVQRVQFSLRPDLVARRDALMSRAGLARERYVRRSVSPDTYLADPDELLPQTGYLWLLDSARAFYQAMELLKLRENEALDAILLLADLLSGGGGSTLLISTDPLGHVASQETTLRRVVVAPDLAFVTGIGIAGRLWTFDLNEQGGVVRYYRDAVPEELW